jgi:hypothetical protein
LACFLPIATRFRDCFIGYFVAASGVSRLLCGSSKQ